MREKYVCELGPGKSYPGGILTVINDYLNSAYLKDFKLIHIVTASKNHKIFTMFKGLTKYLKLCFKKKVALTHIHMSERGSCIRACIFSWVSKCFGIPVIIHSHGGEVIPFYNKLGTNGQKLFKNAMNAADKIIVLTPGWVEFWSEIVPKSKIEILPNFVSVPQIANKQYHYNNKINILFLGLISNKKGVYDLIKSIRILVDEGTKNVYLRIAGNGEIEKCKNFIDKLKLNQYIDVVGWADKEKKDHLLRESDILVLPSHFESFGIVALEALSYKLPVVCGDKGYTKEIINDDVDGCVAKTGDSKDIADKIKLANNNLQKFGNMGRKIVLNKYSEQVVMTNLRDIYSSCLIN